MRSHWCIITAAAITVGAMGLPSTRAADDPNAPKPTAGQRIENAADKTGEALKNAADKTSKELGITKEPGAYQTEHAAAIEKTLAETADAALTKNGLDDMVERFVDADRNRLGQNKDALKNPDPLNGRIDQFQKDWKAKYNEDFNAKNHYDKVFDVSFARITEGGEQGARTASETVKPDANAPDKVNAENRTGIDKPGSADADKNLNDKGRNIATVHIAASHGMPALDVPMIHEALGWKIDLPDSIDANKLRDDVQNALTQLGDKKDQWPSDMTDAYREVTHGVLLAIFDKPLSDSAQPAAGQLPADQGTAPQPVQPVEPAK
jgi:hypothetical protein